MNPEARPAPDLPEKALRELLAAAAARPTELREIVRDTPAAVIAFRTDRTIVAASPCAESYFGYASGELDGSPSEKLVPARCRNPDAPYTRSELFAVQIPALRRDGTEVDTEWWTGTAALAEGPLFFSVVRRATRQVRALELLRHSEEPFRLLVDGVRDHAIFLLDPSGRVVTWNTGAERIKGYSAREIVGRHFSLFYPENDQKNGVCAQVLAQALREGRCELEGWRVRKDGSQFWASVVVTALFDPEGRHVGFAKITRDLTERRRLTEERIARAAAEQAETDAREQARKLKILADASHFFASAAVEVDGALDELVRRCTELTGEACLVLVGRDEDGLIELKVAPPADPLIAEALRPLHGRRICPGYVYGKVAETGRPLLVPRANSREVGAQCDEEVAAILAKHPVQSLLAVPLFAGTRFVAVVAALRFSAGGPFTSNDLALVEDLCSRVGLSLENARLYRELKAAVQGRDELLSVVSHDLRNDLNSILGNAAMLESAKHDDGGDRAKALGRRIVRASRRMNRLLQDLIDRARIELGRPLEVNPSPTDVAALLRELVETFQPLTASHEVRFETSGPSQPCSVLCDADRLQQVFANLVSNALRHTRAGGLISVRASATSEGILFEVADTGSGISPSDLRRIFDRHWQGRSHGGALGLGLAVSRAIVAAHRGTIWAESVEGKGSTFFIALPAAPADVRFAS